MRNDEQELFQKALFLFPMLSRKPEMRAVEPIVETVRISQRRLCKHKIQKRKGKNQHEEGLNKNKKNKIKQGNGVIRYSPCIIRCV